VKLVAAAHRVQGDALLILSQAKHRLADEYDAAQERGEVQSPGGDRKTIISEQNNDPTVLDLGLSSLAIYEARKIRDAEKQEPGIVAHQARARTRAMPLDQRVHCTR